MNTPKKARWPGPEIPSERQDADDRHAIGDDDGNRGGEPVGVGQGRH